jgi:hypothetical protein
MNPNPAEPEANRFEASKNPKPEYRNPKQIRNSKTANQEKTFKFENFGFVSKFDIDNYRLLSER